MDPTFTGDSLHLRSMPGSLEELAQLPQPLVVPQVSVSVPASQIETGSLEELAQLQQPLVVPQVSVSVVPQVSVSAPPSQIEPAQQPLKIPQITINRPVHVIEQFQPSQPTFAASFSASVTADLANQTGTQAQDSENLFSDEENMLTIPLYDTFQNQSPNSIVESVIDQSKSQIGESNVQSQTNSIVETVLDQSKSEISESNEEKKTEEIQRTLSNIGPNENSQSQYAIQAESALNESIVTENAVENIPQNSNPSETFDKSVNDLQNHQNETIVNCETVAMEEETEHDLFKFLEKEKRKAVLESSLEQQCDVTVGNVHTSPLEKSESDTDMLKLVQDRLNEEKNLFSENLGLIPKEIEEKIIMKTRSSSRQMQTRKQTCLRVGKLKIDETVNVEPISGHEHVRGLYKCGGCSKIYTKICKLHEHLNDHTEGGSYHYDHILRTAFPKLGTACANTQTGDDKENYPHKETVTSRRRKNTSKENKPFGRGIQFKKPKVKSLKTKDTIKDLSIDLELVAEDIIEASPPAKKKRGRQKKDKKIHTKEKKVTKIKVKTEDGRTTWREVKSEPDTYIDDIPEAVSDGNMSDSASVSINRAAIDDSTDNTEMLMDMCMKDIESDLASIISSPPSSPKRKSHKRKMTIPRKILHTPTSDSEKTTVSLSDSDSAKIVNSRTKPVKKIKCDFCPLEFQYTRGLIRHEQEMHEEEMQFFCDVCPQKFMREYNLKRHKLCSHTVGKVKFIRKRKAGAGPVLKVKAKPGRKPRVTQQPTECEVCGKMVPASKLDIHIRLHTGDRPYICHVCGKGLISDKKLKRHLLIHSEVRRHTCDVCGEGFSMKYKLRTHMFLHTGHKPYLCSACGAEFNNSTSLLHHHRTVHLGDKRFECTICGGRYGKKSQLEEHMFSHSTERTQTCRYCGKTFKHAKSLRRHEATHVSDEKYPCDQCESKFSRKDNLERHKMCHYDSTLQCSFCKKKFRDKKPLLEHEQFHINQRRFQCQLCKEKFQEETYFYNHMENNHQLTREMVPVINALASGSDSSKDDKDQDDSGVATHDIGIDVMKVQNGGCLSDQQLLPLAGQTQDTLNLSMNVAGIIPVTNHEIIPISSHSAMQNLLSQQNSVVNQLYIPSQNQVNVSRSILNQPATSSFTSTNQIIQAGIHDNQRTALNVMNSMSSADNIGMRITIDEQSGTVSMTSSENLMVHEQQRLMQEALGSSLGVQTPGYRLQNLY